MNWLNGLLGLWLIVIAATHHTGSWTVGITGLVISFCAFWTALSSGPSVPVARPAAGHEPGTSGE